MLELWIAVKEWLVAEAAWVIPLTAIIAALAVVIGWAKWPFKRDKPTQLAPETIDQIKPPQARDGPALTTPEFIRVRRELKADLEQELAEADDAEKAQLRARIAELESQIVNPEKSLAEARKRIADLERLLDREANHIGGDRIARAKAALEQGDYSLADDIFAEIEARNELAVQETARAAHGRGEVAEAEVRWHDAYTHYKRASELHETFDHLTAYARMTWRLAKGAEAISVQEQLVDWAKSEHGDDSAEYATQLNNLAGLVQAQGRYEEAERLYCTALEIDHATIGEGHPGYATRLNNLAHVIQAQGHFEEAERLYRVALKIGLTTIGKEHPAYAIRLTNLADVVRVQGRYVEAEALCREAVELDRATIGEGHPNYATHLNNLAAVVETQWRYEEAEALYREAQEIDLATIGGGHPEYAIRLGNLGRLLGQTGRPIEGRAMLEQALAIFRAALPLDHPHIAETQRRLKALPDD
ncbi:tetratricopeptide repeat protein [Roseovarius ramblicola]|uniref:Tetratricopeptide repeat protein n=1 Tax=Roseovarius ramblicola TaxID=2022336 RepID=A0ABV5HYG4_9RHOB